MITSQCPESRNNPGKLYSMFNLKVGDDRVAAVAVTDESQSMSTSSYFQDICDFGSKNN